MAGAMAAAASLTSASVAIACSTKAGAGSTAGKRSRVPQGGGGVRRLSLHGGLKAQNSVMAMGVGGVSTEQQFADLRARCSARSATSKGGAAASTCDVASEIFTIVPIMSGLVLIGIAVGFLLLRVEAAIEDAE